MGCVESLPSGSKIGLPRENLNFGRERGILCRGLLNGTKHFLLTGYTYVRLRRQESKNPLLKLPTRGAMKAQS